MEVILDTNFIISCILKKIDFLSQLEAKGFKVVVPREVMQELKDLRNKRMTHAERVAIDVALESFSSRKVKKMTIGQGRVDDLLIKMGKQGVFIATLDREVKRQVPNRIVIYNSSKEVGVERGKIS